MVDQSVYFVSVAAQTTSLLYLDTEDQLQGRREVERLPAGQDEVGGETRGGDHQDWGSAGKDCLLIKCSNIGQSVNRSVIKISIVLLEPKASQTCFNLNLL